MEKKDAPTLTFEQIKEIAIKLIQETLCLRQYRSPDYCKGVRELYHRCEEALNEEKKTLSDSPITMLNCD